MKLKKEENNYNYNKNVINKEIPKQKGNRYRDMYKDDITLNKNDKVINKNYDKKNIALIK